MKRLVNIEVNSNKVRIITSEVYADHKKVKEATIPTMTALYCITDYVKQFDIITVDCVVNTNKAADLMFSLIYKIESKFNVFSKNINNSYLAEIYEPKLKIAR